MTMPRSKWLTDLTTAAGRAVELAENIKAGAGDYVAVGAVQPADDRGRGWYRYSKPASRVRLEQLENAVLAYRAGPQDKSHPVTASEVDNGVLYVKTGITTPSDSQYLFVERYDRRKQLEGRRDGLAGLPGGSLAERFGEHRLDPIPLQPTDNTRVSREQSAAFRACCAPGLQVVWGPPGTGKTHVIAEALAHLMASGHSVLLVSNTNIAVDNAIAKLVTLNRPPSGRVVRIGTPAIPEIARNPDVSLTALIQARQADVQRRIDECEEGLKRLQNDPRQSALTDAVRRVEDFGEQRYRAAADRAENRRRLQSVKSELDALEHRERDLDSALGQIIASAVMAEWAVLRAAELAQLAEVSRLGDHLQELSSLPLVHRWRQRRLARRVRSLHIEQEARRIEATRRREDFETEEVERYRGLAEPPSVTADDDPAELRRRRDTLDEDRNTLTQTLSELARHIATVRRRASDAQAKPMPVTGDEELLRKADAAGIPQLLQRLPELRRAAGTWRQELDAATRRYEELTKLAAKQRREIGPKIIAEAQVVATTLALLAMNPAVRTKAYDFVIVDEAGACLIPDLALAVGIAGKGAVLVGDYLQNGPILDDAERRDPFTAEHFSGDCFKVFGITDPRTARGVSGCAVLTEQRRFGRTVTELVNRVAYRGVLEAMSDTGGEIVVIDTEDLGSNLAGIERVGKFKGSWPIGALIAQALAEHHHLGAERESVGVVVPYKEQVRATTEFLEQSPVGPAVEVGTSHTFQGREFDIVLFDMVEDGRGQFASFESGAGDFHLSTLRLFNVAVTRARRRTYLLADTAAFRAAKSGPLAEILRLHHEHKVIRVAARELLGVGSSGEPPALGTPARDVYDALSSYVKLIDIYDQVTGIDPILHRIDHAKTAVWMWSPWIGQYQRLQDALIAAHGRGVAVNVVTLPERELTQKTLASLHHFEGRFKGRIIHMQHMHQKIVVVDDRHCFVGSQNLLSVAEGERDRRKEVMLEIDSGPMAAMLLKHERSTDLLKDVNCPKCGKTMRCVNIMSRDKKRVWLWRCAVGSGACNGEMAFTDAPRPHLRGRSPAWNR
ncbi:superfamily I DNA and/or RNA helicase [Stackebrandtia albiflava]|uniref:Superfamily I DNA and/or RNA helicase n=1 Tax=Stackebrandtia albiflava TaxID=406432 RepID=A0A562URG2_9ACTN|nr:AAA domain-containing protein [Stackebrandtia albiflava]TWJ08197.1 superfamily I DNA and/or RNA helicase [Stackebrandtia albiflava]